MKTILVLFDSLNRRMTAPYSTQDYNTPNFARLARHAVTFDNSYAGSLPCMPARRDLHTGRLNFLHRGWGPMEPYDISVFELLAGNGTHCHLVSDHMHYWEDGGANYHTKYTTWEIVRGQEGDCWKAHVGEYPDVSKLPGRNDIYRAREMVNRLYMNKPEDYPIHKVFSGGLEFLQKNYDKDNWLLQIESFDPHEPFNTHEMYKEKFPDGYDGPNFDWPPYLPVSETPAQVEHAKNCYHALVNACDDYLGRVLDFMDVHDMWRDTMLIVCTDHGYLLGEHGWWAKNRQPVYNELANTPLYIWDPASGVQNEHRSQLVQLIDLAPTLLDFYGLPVPNVMRGKSLRECIAHNAQTHPAVLYGIHGCHVNITDGRYVYMRAPTGKNEPLYDFVLMPSDMKKPFPAARLRRAQLAPPFSFTQGMPLLRVPAKEWSPIDFAAHGNMLFDLSTDPGQLTPIHSAAEEARLAAQMKELMQENDAPAEEYIRLGL